MTFAASAAAPVVMIVSLDEVTENLGLNVDSSTTSAQHFTVAAASAPRGMGVTYGFAFFALGCGNTGTIGSRVMFSTPARRPDVSTPMKER